MLYRSNDIDSIKKRGRGLWIYIINNYNKSFIQPNIFQSTPLLESFQISASKHSIDILLYFTFDIRFLVSCIRSIL